MIGIIGAMSIEIDEIVNKLTEKKEYSYKTYNYVSGKLCGKDVVV